MIRTQIYITEFEKENLSIIAQKYNTTQSEIVRKAIDQFIKKEKLSGILEGCFGMWKDYDLDLNEIRQSMDRK